MGTLLGGIAAGCLLLFAGLGLRSIFGFRRGPLTLEIASALLLSIAALGIVGPLSSLARIDAPWSGVVFLGICAVWGLARRGGALLPRSPRDAGAAGIAMIGIAALVAYSAATVPVLHGDEVFVWGYKSGAIQAQRTIDPTAWTHSLLRGTCYPFALPMTAGVVATLSGEFTAQTGRIVAVLGFVACACALAELLRLRFRGLLLVAALLGILASPVVAHIAPMFMGDVPLLGGIALAVAGICGGPPSRQTIVHIAILALLKLDGATIAAALLGFEWIRAAPGTRARTLLFATVAFLVALLPWALVFLLHGLNPVTGERFGETSRLGEVSGSLGDPARFGGRFAHALARLALSVVPYGLPDEPGDYWSGPGPFGFFLPALVIGTLAAPPHRIALSRWSLGALAAALIVGQAIPLALAPSFEVQLELVLDRAALHLVPALIVLAILGSPGFETLPTRSRAAHSW
jgi:hypothetical protein